MAIRLYNAKILLKTLDGYAVIKGELRTEGRIISYVGPDTAAHEGFASEIDCRGNLLMPGLKNCHTHSAMTLLRGAAEGLPLFKWLHESVFPIEAKLTPEDVYAGTMAAIAEYISDGTTAIQEMYFFNEEIARAVTDAGFKCVAGLPFSDVAGDGEKKLAAADALLEKYSGGGNFRMRAGFHAEYTCSDGFLKGIKYLSDKYKSPVSFHLAETRGEVEDCINRCGMTPAERVDSFGLLARGGSAYHSVYLTDSDIALLKKNGYTAVTNPASNLKLASGIAPLRQFLDAELPVAIGTDGAASNNALDMFRELYLAAVLQNIVCGDAGVMLAGEVLDMALRQGACAMGLFESDMLAVGKAADIIMLDISRPNMWPESALINHIVFSAARENVVMTMVNGQILYRNGEFTTLDSDKIRYECERITARLYGG